eukprot:364268-Chlamydomonas_euryale.AAC.3
MFQHSFRPQAFVRSRTRPWSQIRSALRSCAAARPSRLVARRAAHCQTACGTHMASQFTTHSPHSAPSLPTRANPAL